MILFPFVLSSFSDALVALRRISKFLTAEELGDAYTIDEDRKFAVHVDGDFTWETAGKIEGSKFGGGSGKRKGADAQKPEKKEQKPASKWGRKKVEPVLPTTAESPEESDSEPVKAEEKPFELRDLRMNVPKGAFIAIVGRVGSGKVRGTLLRLLVALSEPPF